MICWLNLSSIINNESRILIPLCSFENQKMLQKKSKTKKGCRYQNILVKRRSFIIKKVDKKKPQTRSMMLQSLGLPLSTKKVSSHLDTTSRISRTIDRTETGLSLCLGVLTGQGGRVKWRPFNEPDTSNYIVFSAIFWTSRTGNGIEMGFW